jgi:hypothetical protein
VGLNPTMMTPSSSQPMGLRGRRAASSVPTAVAGTTAAALVSVSASTPPVPAWWISRSSGTVAMPTPRVTRPNATAAIGAARRDRAEEKVERTTRSP